MKKVVLIFGLFFLCLSSTAQHCTVNYVNGVIKIDLSNDSIATWHNIEAGTASRAVGGPVPGLYRSDLAIMTMSIYTRWDWRV